MPNDKGPNAQRIAFFFIHIQLEYLRLYQFVKLEYLRLYQFVKFYYRPQRSWGQGYVFTRVCDSVHRGGLPQCMLGYCHPPRRRHPLAKETPPEGDPPRRRYPLPRKETSQEGGTPRKETPKKETPPAKETPTKETPQEGDPPRRRHPPPRRPPANETPRRKPPRPTPKGKLRGIMSRPTPKGEIEGDQIQAHTQGGNWGGSDPGPHPRGKLRGIRSRPTPKGKIEGGQIQAHTQGGNWGGSDPSSPPHAGIWSMSGRYASYWNAFLLKSASPKKNHFKNRGISVRLRPKFQYFDEQFYKSSSYSIKRFTIRSLTTFR